MEEADIRSAEVKKASYEFERDIVKGAVNQVLLYKCPAFSCQKETGQELRLLTVNVTVSNAFIDLILPCIVLQRTNKVIAERVTRYIEDKLRARVSIFLCVDEGVL